MKQLLEKTLNEMDVYFTSNEFSRVAKINGISQEQIDNGILADFLHKNAIQLSNSNRRWVKKDKRTLKTDYKDKIDDAINFLKEKGYKVMKPVTDFVEV